MTIVDLILKTQLLLQRSYISSTFSQFKAHLVLLDPLNKYLGHRGSAGESHRAREPHRFQVHLKQLLVNVFVDLGYLFSFLHHLAYFATTSYDGVFMVMLLLRMFGVVVLSFDLRSNSVKELNPKTANLIHVLD